MCYPISAQLGERIPVVCCNKRCVATICRRQNSKCPCDKIQSRFLYFITVCRVLLVCNSIYAAPVDNIIRIAAIATRRLPVVRFTSTLNIVVRLAAGWCACQTTIKHSSYDARIFQRRRPIELVLTSSSSSAAAAIRRSWRKIRTGRRGRLAGRRMGRRRKCISRLSCLVIIQRLPLVARRREIHIAATTLVFLFFVFFGLRDADRKQKGDFCWVVLFDIYRIPRVSMLHCKKSHLYCYWSRWFRTGTKQQL